jgi:hypothetical protein
VREADDPRRALARVMVEERDTLKNTLVFDVLRWPKRMATTTVDGLMRDAGILAPSRTVGQLTDRQVLHLTLALTMDRARMKAAA